MGTLFAELVARAGPPNRPRIYADANVPAGLVAYMRDQLAWDVLFIIEHDDLRRAPDRRHYELARQLGRTLLTLDRDYLDDQRYPPAESGGVIVVWAPTEALLARTLAQLDRRIFRDASGETVRAWLPIAGQKLVADPGWVDP